MKCLMKLHTVPQVYDFVKMASACAGDVLVGKDAYTVNGKSILGLYSLDLTQKIVVTVEERDKELFDKLEQNGFTLTRL